MRTINNNDIREFSLLAPSSSDNYFDLSENTANDLSVDFIAESITCNSTEKAIISRILLHMPIDERIINYRRTVYDELSAAPELCSDLFDIFDAMRFYVNDHAVSLDKSSTIWELLTRLKSLENYANSIIRLNETVKGHEFKSEGMKKFAGYISDIYNNSGFDELTKDISGISDEISNIRSVTIGVNLDPNFYPEETGIISLNTYWFGEQSVLGRFMKYHRKDQLNDKDLMPFTMEMHDDGLDRVSKKFGKGGAINRPSDSPLMNNLNKIIERMLPSMTAKLKKVINKYVDTSGKALAELADEFLFYLKFIELEKKLRNIGLPCCSGVYSAKDSSLRDFYNVKLAICSLQNKISEDIVCNDLEFTDDKTVQILTGPNRGGKTILTQGIGLAFLLFQSGVFVPAASAEIHPCNGIYTHFPVEEERTVSLGRLGEEADRFNTICKTADHDSLLLFNESFATTSHTESLYIAEDVLKYLCFIGARTCFNTHMHELGENAHKLSSADSSFKAVSVVMENDNGKRSYKISYKKPDGKSYAHEIALKYGITFEQLCENIK